MSYRQRLAALTEGGERPPSFANLLAPAGWVFYGYREENEVTPCDDCGVLTEEGFLNLGDDVWLCQDCFEREVSE